MVWCPLRAGVQRDCHAHCMLNPYIRPEVRKWHLNTFNGNCKTQVHAHTHAHSEFVYWVAQCLLIVAKALINACMYTFFPFWAACMPNSPDPISVPQQPCIQKLLLLHVFIHLKLHQQWVKWPYHVTDFFFYVSALLSLRNYVHGTII